MTKHKKKTKNTIDTLPKKKINRDHPLTAMFTEEEYDSILKYCKQYKIKNKSEMIRKMIFAGIFKDYNDNYPTLFDKHELADLVVERR